MLADISGTKRRHIWVKIEELETNSKVNNVSGLYRDIDDLKKGYQPRTTIEKDEKGDLVADPTVLRRGGETISPAIECKWG